MYSQPKIVTEYYNRRPPKCCFSCEYFLLKTAECTKHHQVVPEEFAQEFDVCPDWSEMRIPF